jgi:hypothetical protein
MYSPSADNIGMDLTVPTVRMVNKSADTLLVGDVVVMSTAHTGVVYPPATRTQAALSPLACVVKAGSSPFTPGFIGTVARLGPLDGRTEDTVDVVFGGLAKAKVAAVTTDVVLGTQLSLSSTTGQLTNDATGRVVAVALGAVTAGQTANIDVILDGEIAADTATLGTFATLAVTGTATIGGNATINGLNVGTGTAAAPTSNTVMGSGAGAALQAGGTNNVLIGSSAGAAITTGDDVVAIGFDAAKLNTASDTVAIGSGALDANTTGTNNTAVGRNALGANTDAADNTAVGHNALAANTTGFSNTAMGRNALGANTDGFFNTVIGKSAFQASITGFGNTIVGTNSFQSISGADGNCSLGRDTGINMTSGGNNVALGHNAQRFRGSGTDTLTSATSSIFIGFQSRAAGDSQTNQVVIAGTDGLGNGSNTTTIGNGSTAGTFIPAGNLTLTNGNLILGTSGNGISFAATSDPTIAAVAATGVITRTATNVSNNDTVTIGAITYTFKTTLTPTNYEVLIGADSSASLTNLRNAILGTGGSPGDYQVPAAHPTVTASAISGTFLPLVAITAGTAGNSIALSDTAAQLSVSGVGFLTGGRDAQGATSELLNDYEIGTWTPRFTPESGSYASIVTIVKSARYVKVGRLVYVTCWINTRNFVKGTASGACQISGIPYAVSGGAGEPYAGAVGRVSSWESGQNVPLKCEPISALINLWGHSSLTAASSLINVANMQEGVTDLNDIVLSCTYVTD